MMTSYGIIRKAPLLNKKEVVCLAEDPKAAEIIKKALYDEKVLYTDTDGVIKDKRR